MEFLHNIPVELDVTKTYKWGLVDHKLNFSRQLSVDFTWVKKLAHLKQSAENS